MIFHTWTLGFILPANCIPQMPHPTWSNKLSYLPDTIVPCPGSCSLPLKPADCQIAPFAGYPTLLHEHQIIVEWMLPRKDRA